MPRPPGFWDERYSEKGYAYGTEPNDFVRDHVAAIPHGGRVLCLAEGQGRNAVFLAQRGFVVTAMDQSAIGLNGAKSLSREKGVHIDTVAADLEVYDIEPGAWQGIVSVFAHLPPALRRAVHGKVVAGLAPGGALLLEAYAPRQLELKTGGPEDAEQMPGVETLKEELAGLEFEVAREVERVVQEGRYHTGRAATVQILGRKPL
jgi:SAM-dependent methyltransferase